MAISYVGAGSVVTTAAGATSITITAPTVSAGDVILLCIHGSGISTGAYNYSGTATLTSISTAFGYYVTSGGSASITMTGISNPSAVKIQGVALVYRSDVGNIVAKSTTTNTVTAATSLTAPSLSINTASSTVVSFWGMTSSVTSYTAPSSTTSRISTGIGSGNPATLIVDELTSNLVTSPSRTATASPASLYTTYAVELYDGYIPVFAGPTGATFKNVSTISFNSTFLTASAGGTILLGFVASSATNTYSVTITIGGTAYTPTNTTGGGWIVMNGNGSNGALYIFELTNVPAFSNSQFSVSITAGSSVLCSPTALFIPAEANIQPPNWSTTNTRGTSTGASTTPSVTSSFGISASTSYLLIGFVATGGPNTDTFTNAAGWYEPPTRLGTASAGAATNRTIAGGYAVVTGSTSYTYAPTLGTSRNWAAGLFPYPVVTGSTVTGSTTETVTVTDSSNATFTPGGLQNETVTATDSQISQLDAVASLTEAVTATDSVGRTVDYVVGRTESASVTDSSLGGLQVSGVLTESVSASDSQNATITLSPRTGTMAVTETGSDTASISGKVVVKGALAGIETGNDTTSFSGKVKVQGTLDVSETGVDIFTSSGKIYVKGSLTATETGNDTASFSGKVITKGSLAVSETGNDTFVSLGKVYIQGTLASTETGNDTASIAGKLEVKGSLSVSEIGDDHFSASALVITKGVLDVTETGLDTFYAIETQVTYGTMSAKEVAALPYTAKYWNGSAWTLITKASTFY